MLELHPPSMPDVLIILRGTDEANIPIEFGTTGDPPYCVVPGAFVLLPAALLLLGGMDEPPY